MDTLFLGIDAGTTKIKAVLFNQRGEELKLARRTPKLQREGNDYVTQDMNDVWINVVDAIKEVVCGCEKQGEIKAIGITAQGDGLWMIDKAGKSLQNAVSWIDGRAKGYIEKWKDQGIAGASGRIVFAGSPLAFAAWYYDNEPAVMEKAEKVLFCKDWVKYCLTGQIVTDPTDLSDASLIKYTESSYSKELLDQFGTGGLVDLLPDIKGSTDIIGHVSKQAAKETGLREGIPVANGLIDVVATAIGSGVFESGQAASIIGTTLYNEIIADKISESVLAAESPPSVISHATADKKLLTYGTMTGAPNIDWFIQQAYSNTMTFEEAEKIIKEIPTGSNGIVYLPYLGAGGERAPFVKATASAQFYGVKAFHTKDHMLRAVYEGVACSMKDCYAHFPEMPSTIRLSGGGSACHTWCQMFADCVGSTIETVKGNEIGALGAVITAAVGIGFFSNINEGISEMVRVNKSYETRSTEFEKYNRIYEVYKRLYMSLWNIWDMKFI